MHSKIRSILLSIFFATSLLFHTSALNAGGWGTTKETIEHEGTTWNGVYYDMNGLNFLASIPNYSHTVLQGGIVCLKGKLKRDGDYVIITSFNPGFKSPRTAQEFVKMIQDANPSYIVTIADSDKLGAKHAVDMIPVNQRDTVFWRFLCTNDRLIKMCADDTNENRRSYFFESLYIH